MMEVMVATRTSKPFVEAMQELLEDREMSQRELVRRTRKHGWGSTGAISLLMHSELAPTIRSMEAIAQALAVPPEYFAEYRLSVARRDLDPAVVGIETALRNLGE